MGRRLFQEQLHIIQKLYCFLQTYTAKFYKEKLRSLSGYFRICSAKLTLSCNDHLVKVKYSDKYKVFNNFSLSYHKKHYDYREYRFRYRGFELCASNDSRVQGIWKTGNSLREKILKSVYCPSIFKTIKKGYVVGKQFNAFLAGSAQSFDKYEYRLHNGRLKICAEKLKPATVKLTKEDLLLCNDSLINVKFDDQYKVWNNFSMLFKNKVYRLPNIELWITA